MKRAVLHCRVLGSCVVLSVNALGAAGDFPVISGTLTYRSYEANGTADISKYPWDPDTRWYIRNKWGPCNDMDPTRDTSWHIDGKASCRFNYKLMPCSHTACDGGYAACVPKVITNDWTTWNTGKAWHGMRFYIKPDGLGREMEFNAYDMCKAGFLFRAIFTPTGTDPVVVYMPWESFKPKGGTETLLTCDQPKNIGEDVLYVNSPPMDSGHFWIDAWAYYKATAELEGITVMPASALTAPVRINAGEFRSSYTDNSGNTWRPDVGYSQSVSGNQSTLSISDPNLNVGGTASPKVFQSLRLGPAAYYLPIVNGEYTVNLLFSELSSSVTAAGQRVFSVRVNDQQIAGIDVFKESGGRGKPLTKTAKVTVVDSLINIVFTGSGAQPPVISGIEVTGKATPTVGRSTTTRAPGAALAPEAVSVLYTINGQALRSVPQAYRGVAVSGRPGTQRGSASAVVRVR